MSYFRFWEDLGKDFGKDPEPVPVPRRTTGNAASADEDKKTADLIGGELPTYDPNDPEVTRAPSGITNLDTPIRTPISTQPTTGTGGQTVTPPAPAPSPVTPPGTTPPPAGGGGGGGGRDKPKEEKFRPVIIPDGGVLVRVKDPTGSDANAIFYVEYQWSGIPIRFEIGTRKRLKELFGEDFDAPFTDVTLRSQTEVDETGVFWGSVDEILGTKESLASQVERGLKEVGAGDIAQWQRDDPNVMLILVTAAREGWAPDKTLMAISKTDAFGTRYSGFDDWRKAVGTTGNLSSDLNAYVAEEANVIAALRAFRGPNTDLSTTYVGSLLSSGWSSGEMAEVLDFEQRLAGAPEALDNLNELLTFNNLEPVDAMGMLELTRGNAAPEVFEVLSDALRQTALEQQGLTVGTGLAAALGQGSAMGLQSQESIIAQAQSVAVDIFANKRELDLGKFGLTEEQLLRAAFNGDVSAEVATRLGQLARERQAAASGFTDLNAFQGSEGQIQMVGLKGL